MRRPFYYIAHIPAWQKRGRPGAIPAQGFCARPLNVSMVQECREAQNAGATVLSLEGLRRPSAPRRCAAMASAEKGEADANSEGSSPLSLTEAARLLGLAQPTLLFWLEAFQDELG